MDNDTSLSYPASWEGLSQLDKIELMLNKLSFGEDLARSQGYKEGLRKAVEVVKVCKANWIYTGNPDEIDECVWQLETLIKES